MRRSVFFSLIAEIGASLSMFLTFRLASEFWGVSGFAEWIMARRLMAVIVPVITMGMDVGLTRAIASSRENLAQPYLLAACLVVGVMAAVTAVATVPFAQEISQIVFGNTTHADLVVPVFIMSAAYAFYVLLYGLLRGRFQIMEANLAHICAYGVLPLLAIFIFHTSPSQSIAAIGAAAAIATGFFLIKTLSVRQIGIRMLREATHQLVAYGGSRMVAAIMLMSLALLPASIAAYRAGIEAGGFVALALSVIGLAGSASAPIQLILLPMASAMWANGRLIELKAAFGRLELVIVCLGVAAVVVVPLIAPVISALVVGQRDPQLELALGFAGPAVGPFMYFVCGRQIIDACTVKGMNTRNLFFGALGFFIALVMLTAAGVGDVAAVMLSYSCAMLVIAVATGRTIRNLFSNPSVDTDEYFPK
jgi:O-antigen/teichoic acid export membrane protein